jgi:hypothetical protein
VATSNLPTTGVVVSSCTSGRERAVVLSTSVGTPGTLDPTLHDRTWVLPNWYCNSASSIKLSATSLRLSNPRAAVKNGESQVANFTAHATGWSNTTARVTTADQTTVGTLAEYTGPAQPQLSSKTGTITLKVDDFQVVGRTIRSTPKLVAGNYSARITITLGPGI